MGDKFDFNTPQWINVGYDMKNQIKLFVGERSKTQFDSGCKMFDLHLQDPFQVTKKMLNLFLEIYF